MDPKLTELFNQLKLTFEHFAEAMDQASQPATGEPGSPSDAAVQTGPSPAPGLVDQPLQPETMSDDELNEQIAGKKPIRRPGV